MAQISLKAALGGGSGVEVGECVYLFDGPNSLVTLDNMTFLKSGAIIKNEISNYPDAYARYMVNGDRTIQAGAWALSSTTGLGTVALNSIAFGNGIFLGVGTDGFAYTSVDGKTWTKRSAVVASILSVAFGNGIFICVGSSGTTYRSADGVTWLTSACVGQTILFDTGSAAFYLSRGTPYVWRSTDGITWSQGNAMVPGTSNVNAFSVYNGLVAVFGYYFDGSTGYFMTSPDRLAWTQVSNTGAGNIFNYAVYGAGTWVATGAANAPFLKYSTNAGITWTQASIVFATNETITGVYYWPGLFLLTGYTGLMAMSIDGINWTRITHGLGAGNLTSIASDNLSMVVAGASGVIGTTPAVVDKLLGLATAVPQLHMRIK